MNQLLPFQPGSCPLQRDKFCLAKALLFKSFLFIAIQKNPRFYPKSKGELRVAFVQKQMNSSYSTRRPRLTSTKVAFGSFSALRLVLLEMLGEMCAENDWQLPICPAIQLVHLPTKRGAHFFLTTQPLTSCSAMKCTERCQTFPQMKLIETFELPVRPVRTRSAPVSTRSMHRVVASGIDGCAIHQVSDVCSIGGGWQGRTRRMRIRSNSFLRTLRNFHLEESSLLRELSKRMTYFCINLSQVAASTSPNIRFSPSFRMVDGVASLVHGSAIRQVADVIHKESPRQRRSLNQRCRSLAFNPSNN